MDRNNDAPERPAMMSPQRFRFFLFGGMMLMFVVGALVLLFHPPYGIVLVQGVTAAFPGNVVLLGLVIYMWARSKITLRRLNPEDKG
jgi:hypothetical protein